MIVKFDKGPEFLRALFFAVCCLTAAVVSYARPSGSGGQMEFNNTVLGGSLPDLVRQFESNGCYVIGQTENQALLQGSFVAYGDCTIYVEAEEDMVKEVNVYLPNQISWSALYNNYLYMKQVMSMSYGMPTEDEETFSSRDIDDDMSRMDDLLAGGANVYSTWVTCDGSVSVALDYKKGAGARVMIAYRIN